MIVLDTSVWVDYLNDTVTPQVSRLREIITQRLAYLLVGDLVLCEVLQGLATGREAIMPEQALRRFVVKPMVSPEIATKAALNFRTLRLNGITVRKAIDMLIGTF